MKINVTTMRGRICSVVICAEAPERIYEVCGVSGRNVDRTKPQKTPIVQQLYDICSTMTFLREAW